MNNAWERHEDRGVLEVVNAQDLILFIPWRKKQDRINWHELKLFVKSRSVKSKKDFTEMGVDGMLTSVNSGP